MKKFDEFVNESVIDRTPYKLGKDGLEEVREFEAAQRSNSNPIWYLTKEQYDKLLPLSKKSVELIALLDQEKQLRKDQFTGAVQEIQRRDKKDTNS